MSLNGTGNFARETAAVFRVGQLYIINFPSCGAKILRMMAHGGQDIHHLGFMVRYIFGLFINLSHEDDACFFILPRQG